MPYADPEKRREYHRKYSPKWAARHPDRVLVWNRRATRKYRLKQLGLTLEQFDEMLAAQDGRCATCGVSDPAGRGQGAWCTDHDHRTGKVRGILCHNCNVSLGLLEDSIPTLTAMIAYLMEN